MQLQNHLAKHEQLTKSTFHTSSKWLLTPCSGKQQQTQHSLCFSSFISWSLRAYCSRKNMQTFNYTLGRKTASTLLKSNIICTTRHQPMERHKTRSKLGQSWNTHCSSFRSSLSNSLSDCKWKANHGVSRKSYR